MNYINVGSKGMGLAIGILLLVVVIVLANMDYYIMGKENLGMMMGFGGGMITISLLRYLNGDGDGK